MHNKKYVNFYKKLETYCSIKVFSIIFCHLKYDDIRIWNAVDLQIKIDKKKNEFNASYIEHSVVFLCVLP